MTEKQLEFLAFYGVCFGMMIAGFFIGHFIYPNYSNCPDCPVCEKWNCGKCVYEDNYLIGYEDAFDYLLPLLEECQRSK